MNKYYWTLIATVTGVGGYFLIKKVVDEILHVKDLEFQVSDKDISSESCLCDSEDECQKTKKDLDEALEDLKNLINDSTYNSDPLSEKTKDGVLIVEKESLHTTKQDSMHSDDQDFEIPEDFVPAINTTWKKKKEKLLFFAVIEDPKKSYFEVKIYDYNEKVENYLEHKANFFYYCGVDINDKLDVLSFMEYASTLNVSAKQLERLYAIWNIKEEDWECYHDIVYKNKKRSKTVKKYFGDKK